MKKWIFLLFLILGYLGYTGFQKAPGGLIYIFDSSLRGRSILLPNQWAVYPEAAIPGLGRLEKIPARMPLSGEVNIQLPYSQMMEYLNLTGINISFSGYFVLNEKNSAFLFAKGWREIQKEKETFVAHTIRRIVAENQENPRFSKEIFIHMAKETFQETDYQIEFQVIRFPLWSDYFSLSQKLKELIRTTLEQTFLDLFTLCFRRAMDRADEKKRWEEHFASSLEMARKVSESPHQDLIFKLLEYMKNTEKK